MKSRFGETKQYLFGAFSYTKAGAISILKFKGTELFNKTGARIVLFGRIDVAATFEKIICYVVFAVCLFIFISVAILAICKNIFSGSRLRG